MYTNYLLYNLELQVKSLKIASVRSNLNIYLCIIIDNILNKVRTSKYISYTKSAHSIRVRFLIRVYKYNIIIFNIGNYI